MLPLTDAELKSIDDFKAEEYVDVETKIIAEDLSLKFGNLKRFYESKIDEDRELKRREELEKHKLKTAPKQTDSRIAVPKTTEPGNPVVGTSPTNPIPNTAEKIAQTQPLLNSAIKRQRTTLGVMEPRESRTSRPLKVSGFEDIKRKPTIVTEINGLKERNSRVSELVHLFNEKVSRLSQKAGSSRAIVQTARNSIPMKDEDFDFGGQRRDSGHSIESPPTPEESQPKRVFMTQLPSSQSVRVNHRYRLVQKSKSCERIQNYEEYALISHLPRSQSANIKKLDLEGQINRLQFLVNYFLYETTVQQSVGFQKKLQEEKQNCDEIIHRMEQEKASRLPFYKKMVKNKLFKKLWANSTKSIKSRSFFSNFSSYTLKPLIMKGGDDLRQEVFAMQLFKKFHQIFTVEQTGLYIRPYDIMVTSSSAGFLEFLNDTTTVSSMKKKFPNESFSQIYRAVFGEKFEYARKNFVESLAGYSLLCYLLQIKDRHNGNIMITHEGHMLHIDFGFLLSNAPGNFHFETAPFKFTQDYMDLMDGQGSDYYEYFLSLMMKGLVALNKHLEEIMALVKITSEKSALPCFKSFNLAEFKNRFRNHLYKEPERETLVR